MSSWLFLSTMNTYSMKLPAQLVEVLHCWPLPIVLEDYHSETVVKETGILFSGGNVIYLRE